MLVLRTFGGLELTTEAGERVAGAAAQRKPLLILALAALVPGGISRDRLLRALWPGTDRARARATLKQHLYALRRATGNHDIVGGSPRLRVAEDAVRIDALEFAEHVAQGRLGDAATLLRGDLLEEVGEPAGEALRAIVGELREAYAARVALVRKAASVDRGELLAAPPTVAMPALCAERELGAAARRFVRSMITLPPDAIAARHRAAANNHDLMEALLMAENAGLTPARIREALVDVATFWSRSELLRQMKGAPLGQPGAIPTLEWLLDGGIRSIDPVGRALEAHLLECSITAQFRARADWEQRELTRLLATQGSRSARILAFGPRARRDVVALGAAARCAVGTVVISESDDESAELARMRVAPLDHRISVVAGDPFERLDALAQLGPFDLVLGGTILDHVSARQGSWLTERLLRMLTPEGTLCLSSLPANDPYGAWLRYIANWNLVERDQDDILLLTSGIADECDIAWQRDPAGQAWLVSVRRNTGARGAQAAA